MKLTDSITYFVLNTLKKYLSSISDRSRYKFSINLANFLYHYANLRKEEASANLIKAFPRYSEENINQILKKTYLFFCNNFIQFISAPKSWNSIKINVIGEDLLSAYLKRGNGVVFVSGHFGAWEILGKWLGEYSDLFAGIALRQKNKGANKFFHEQRELPGTKQFYKKNSIEKAYMVLSKNGVLGLVSDQDAKKKGVFVNFFGKPASTPKGAAMFHLNSSAPIMLGVCIQTGFQEYTIKLLPIDTSSHDIKVITQNYTSLLEGFIKTHPEQYFWFHNRWKTKQ